MTRILILYNMGGDFLILRIDGDRSIYLLFCDSKTLNLSNDKYKIGWLVALKKFVVDMQD